MKVLVVNFKMESYGYDSVTGEELLRKVQDNPNHADVIYGEDMYIEGTVAFEGAVEKIFGILRMYPINPEWFIRATHQLQILLLGYEQNGTLIRGDKYVPWVKYKELKADRLFFVYDEYV